MPQGEEVRTSACRLVTGRVLAPYRLETKRHAQSEKSILKKTDTSIPTRLRKAWLCHHGV